MELHGEDLELGLDELGPEHADAPSPYEPHEAAPAGAAHEEAAFEELLAPVIEPRRSGPGPSEFEFDELELSGLDAVPGAAGVEFHEPATQSPVVEEEWPVEEAPSIGSTGSTSSPQAGSTSSAQAGPEQEHSTGSTHSTTSGGLEDLVFEDTPAPEPQALDLEFDGLAPVAQHGEAPAQPAADDLIFEELASEAPSVAPPPVQQARIAPPARPAIRPPAKTPPKKIGKVVRSVSAASEATGNKPPVAKAPGKAPPRPAIRRPSATRGTDLDASMGQTDVFSGVGNAGMAPVPADPAFGGAAGPVPLNDDASISSNGARRKPVPPPVRPVAKAPVPAAKGRPAVAAVPPSGKAARPAPPIKGARPAPQADTLTPDDGATDLGTAIPAASPAAPSRPSSGKRWLLLVLVAIVLLLTAAAVVVVLLMRLHTKTAIGVFQFKGSSNLTAVQRMELKGQQQQLLADPALHAAALNIARSKGASPGFLGASPADAADFSALAASANWDENGEQLIFTRSGTDDSDKPRMSAVLEALYTRNRSLNDEAGQLHSAYAEAVRKADDARSKLEDLDRRIQHDTELAKNADAMKSDAAKIKASLEALVKDRDATEAAVRALEAEIKPLEPAVSVTEAPTTGPTMRSTDSAAPAVAVNPDDDEQVRQLTAEQEHLRSNLKAAKDARDAQASQAATLLDAAQKQFDAQIQAARDAAGGGAMAQFLVALKNLGDLIHHLNDDLIQQQKDQRQFLDEKKEELAKDDAARIKQVWDEDTGPGVNLKDLQQRLAATERRYNAALGVDLLKDADAIKAEMAQLNKQIKARQDLLASKDLYNPLVKKVQDIINHVVQQMEDDRARNDAHVQEALQGLEKARPESEKLPAEQQALAAQLEASSKALKEARDQYNKTQEENSARNDAIVQGLASQVASQQAKIDDRKKQLAVAAAQVLTPEQKAQQASDREHGRQSEYQKKQDELATARAEQADAAAKYDQAMLQFLTLQAEAGNAAEAGDRVKQGTADRQALLPLEQDANQQLQAAGSRLQNIVEPQKPTESSVTLEGEDPRMTYVLFVVSGGSLLTIVLLLLLARHPQPAAYAEFGQAKDEQTEYGQESLDVDDYADASNYEDEENYQTADEGYTEPALTPANAAAAVRGAALVHG
jgi:hypothetical protein